MSDPLPPGRVPSTGGPFPPDELPPRPAPPVSGPLPATPVGEVTDVPPSGGGTGSTGGFEVNPAVITGAAGVFDAEASALVEGSGTTAARLTTLGACWGDDAVGARFGMTYQPAAERVLGNIAALSTGLTRIAAALRAVGTSYQTVDNDIAAVVDEYARRLAAGATTGGGSDRP